jgi:hypothetical protein
MENDKKWKPGDKVSIPNPHGDGRVPGVVQMRRASVVFVLPDGKEVPLGYSENDVRKLKK